MKERSPPGLVVAYSVGSAIWHLIFGGRASSGSTSKLHRQSSIPHSFSTGELAKFSDTGLSHIADLADELELDGNFEELLGNSLAIALDVFKANWFLCTKMTLETCTVLVTLYMQQYLILAILAALVILLCIEDFLIVQETCSNSRPEVPPAHGTKGKHSETQREAADEKEAVVDQRISGSWIKVGDLSDSMEAAADLLRLGGFARKCTVLFKGMEVELKDETLSLTALTHIPFFRAPTETYDLGGKLSVYNRRDMRKGQFSGYIKARADGGINFFYRWGEPFSGHCCDEIVLEDGGNSLIITTTLTLENGESCVYRVVYRRANAPATPPSSHLLKRIEMMKNSTHPHPHFHTPHHSTHHSPHLQINTHRPPPHHGHSHLHAQPQKRDSSQSVVSQHGSQSFRRKGTPDLSDSCPSERNETTVPARQRVSEDSERGRSPQRNALTATSNDPASPFYPAAATPSGSRLCGQATRSSMDSASDAIHASNGSTRERRDRSVRGQRKAGDDLRRSSATFSEFMKL